MEPRPSRFNRNLLIVLTALFVVTLGAFNYANWAADPGFMQWWMLLLNILILAIPLALLYGGIYLLVVARREHAMMGQVRPRLAAIIHWAPRAAAIAIIFFVSLFSLDVFEMGGSPLELLGGFLIHNIPAILMIVMLLFAWKRPVVGFVAFLAAGILFIAYFVRDIRSLPNLFLFVLPILLVAGLFYADWKWIRPRATTQAGFKGGQAS